MKKKEMSHRKLNFYITLIAAFLGIAIPQNNKIEVLTSI